MECLPRKQEASTTAYDRYRFWMQQEVFAQMMGSWITRF